MNSKWRPVDQRVLGRRGAECNWKSFHASGKGRLFNSLPD
jgi:hypothetical protein